jgi:hypothetical protein
LTGDLMDGDTITDASLMSICCAADPEIKAKASARGKINFFIL